MTYSRIIFWGSLGLFLGVISFPLAWLMLIFPLLQPQFIILIFLIMYLNFHLSPTTGIRKFWRFLVLLVLFVGGYIVAESILYKIFVEIFYSNADFSRFLSLGISFAVIGIIIGLLTAERSQEKTVSQPLNTKRIYFVGFIFFAIVFLVSAVFITSSSFSSQPHDRDIIILDNTNTQRPKIFNRDVDSNSSEVSNVNKNWKTYKNEEYGFEFKYPEDWGMKDKDLSRHVTVESNLGNGTFDIWVGEAAKDNTTPDKSLTTKLVFVGGVEGYEVEPHALQYQESYFVTEVKVIKDSFLYNILYVVKKDSDYNSNIEIHKKILSTFKFITP